MRTALLAVALMILASLTAFATMNSAQEKTTDQLEIVSDSTIAFEASHTGCSGDQSIGGCHLATDEWWERPTYIITAADQDGDGIPNAQDRFPFDHTMPASSGSQPLLSCTADVRFPCHDNVGVSLFGGSTTRISTLSDLGYTFDVQWVDVDLDGDMDLSVSDAFGIKLFLNHGSGFSSTPDASLTGSNQKPVFSHAWADVDMDGDMDLMMGNFPEMNWATLTPVENASGDNELYLNDNGSLTGPAWSAPGSGYFTTDVAWGDVNGDGWMDVAFSNGVLFDSVIDMNTPAFHNRIYLNNGAGQLQTSAWWTSADQQDSTGITLADVNDDGDIDMLVTNQQVESGSTCCSTGGVCCDGEGGACCETDWEGGFLQYYENDGGFTSTPTWSNASTNPTATRQPASIADLDGDGDLDVVLVTELRGDHSPPEGLKVLNFDGSGFDNTSFSLTGNNFGAPQFTDWDQDGDYDLLVIDTENEELCIYGAVPRTPMELLLGITILSQTPAECNGDIGGAEKMSLGDFDADGDSDLITFSSSMPPELWTNIAQTPSKEGGSDIISSQASLFLRPSDETEFISYQDMQFDPDEPYVINWELGGITAFEVYKHNPQAELSVVISRRGDDHGCSASHPLGAIQCEYNGATYFRSLDYDGQYYAIDLNTSLDAMAVADLDNDGDMDILGASHNGFTSYLRQPTPITIPGSGSTIASYTLPFSNDDWNLTGSGGGDYQFSDISLGDVNGDGFLDAAIAFEDHGGSPSTPGFCIYLNNGDGLFASDPAFCSAGHENAASVEFNDFDGDGDSDLAVGIESPDSAIVVYRNDGAGQFTRLEIPHPVCLSSCEVQVVDWKDIDRDGDDDLIVGTGMNRIAVFYNMGGMLSPQFSRSTTELTDVNDFAWADIDGDGWEDLIAAQRDGSDLIHRNVHGNLSDTPIWRSGDLSDTDQIIALDSNEDGYIEIIGYDGSGIWLLDTVIDNDLDFIRDVQYHDDHTDNNNEDIFRFDPTQAEDDDEDGYGDDSDGILPDSCSNIYGESWRDRWGCTDEDSDGQSNLYDDFWIKDTQWTDSDGDGLGDNWGDQTWTADREDYWPGEFIPNAYNPDENPMDFDNDGYENANLFPLGTPGDFDNCPQVYGVSSEDLFGCPDMDLDGWSDFADAFPGDGSQWDDTDSDGYGDNEFGSFADSCPTQAGNSSRDVFGCIDHDGDGWSELSDFDDDDSWEWSDLDGDGFGDNLDQCKYDAGDVTDFADIGCPDADGDGVADRSDAFPNLIWHWEDADEDGVGDNQNAPNGMYDRCPSEEGTSHRMQVLGCPDSDSDGFADEYDDCPDVPGLSVIAAIGCADSDGDGLPDEYDLYPGPHGGNGNDYDGDGYLNVVDDFPYDRTQFRDSDGDGRGDNISAGATDPDLFPDKAGAWDDSDGDGWTDQLNNNFTDDCPSIPGNSEIPWRGCPDIDGDGIMDLADEDADGDGISNTLELQAGGAEAVPYNIYDAGSRPADLDGDGMPDSLDDDSDGDGFPDDLEQERGSDPHDANVTPLNMYGSESGLYYIPGEGFSSQYSVDGIELSASVAVALATSEYLGMLLLLPLSVLMLMRKSLRYKKVKRRLENLDEPGELDDFEEEIDDLIGNGKVKVEHGLLLRNLFERTRDELSFSSTEQQLADRPTYPRENNPRDSGEMLLEERPKRGPPPRFQEEVY